MSDCRKKATISTDDCGVEDYSKPPIILTLRTNGTVPKTYFSTANDLSIKKRKAKKSFKPLYSEKTEIIFHKESCDDIHERQLNRLCMSNNDDTVFQSAVSLRKNSYHVGESISSRKKNSMEKLHGNFHQICVQNSTSNLVSDLEFPLPTTTDRTTPSEHEPDKIHMLQHIDSRDLHTNSNDGRLNSLKIVKKYKHAWRYKINFYNKRQLRRKRERLNRRNINNRLRRSAKYQTRMKKSTRNTTSSSKMHCPRKNVNQTILEKSWKLRRAEHSEKLHAGNTENSSLKSTLIDFDREIPDSCLCQVDEKVFMKVDVGTKYCCQAVDSVEEHRISCYIPVQILENRIMLRRPSIHVMYIMFCEDHLYRLMMHNCCPACGLFCTQGKFAICESQHIYHRKCELVVENNRLCPHCGQMSLSIDVSCVMGPNKNPVFLPPENIAYKTSSAKMSFHGSFKMNNDIFAIPAAIIPSRSYMLPSGKKITAEGFPTSEEKDRLLKFLEVGLPCTNSSSSNRYSYRLLYEAVSNGDLENTLNCLCYGLNPNHLYRELGMGSALHAACAVGFLSIVHILSLAGAELDLVDREQNTALILAAIEGHGEIVKYLIKAGAGISFKGKDGMTPLHYAAKHGQLEICHYLLGSLKAPSNYVNMIDDGGWTPLIWAAEFCHIDVVLYLLSQRADLLIRDNEQNVALHWAAFSGNAEIIECLLHYKTDINCTNIRGDTPLHICARRNHYSCVVLILARGARTDLRNEEGLLALDCCETNTCDSYNVIKLDARLKEITKSRKEPLKSLSNDITRGQELNPIRCVNDVDEESEPTNFIYIIENCLTTFIKIDETITSLKSCKCTDFCNSASCICGGKSWYTQDRKLSSDFNYTDPPLIFECNQMCLCNKITCNNRVVQSGATSKLELFRTTNKGWGVRTLEKIFKGTFVCEYVGEIISDTEADTREEDSYLFDLDNRDEDTYCIDAFKYGNIARFVNHCCVPNLQPIKIFIGHQDSRFPRIAFFASRDIEINEELGTDYGETFWIIKHKCFPCSCEAKTCRYTLRK